MAHQQTHRHKHKPEDWFNNKWRPAMGWMYMAVCMCDFMLFPILWSMLQAHDHGQVTSQWQPLTLQGSGLFHVAMGAVLGITAYGRTREKIFGVNGEVEVDPVSFGPNAGTTYVPPNSAGYVNVTSNNTPATNFGTNNAFNNNTNTSSFNNSGSVASASTTSAPTNNIQPPVFGAKPIGPPQSPFPEK